MRASFNALLLALAATIAMPALALAGPISGGQRSGQLWTAVDESGPAQKISSLPDFIALAARLGPTVVNISTENSVPASEELPPGERSDSDLPGLGDYEPRSLGSGFIINKQGYILTNDHVIEDADRILVTTKDGNEYKARLVGRDEKTDIALIKIDPRGDLLPAPLGNSDRLRVGQWVVAIGNPFGFDHSVTAGIVSAIGRFIPGNYDDFIQTDASINPGNSGGPLIDMEGAVVGVNSAIFTRTGGNTGIGFAVPINLVKEEVAQLKDKGSVVRGWLGVYIRRVTPELAAADGLESPQGALVADVLKDGPAQLAGLRRGDVIVAFDDQPISDSQELPLRVGAKPVGDTATVKVVRGRSVRKIRVQILASREEEMKPRPAIHTGGPGSIFGLRVEDLNSRTAAELGVGAGSGVMVASVEPGSSGEGAGLRARDVILQVNRQAADNVAAYERALRNLVPGKPVLLLVRRDRKTVFVPLSPND